MTKEPMIEMYFPNQYVKTQVGEYVEQRRQERVAAKGEKKSLREMRRMNTNG
jgi:hypothetical protein